MACEHPAIENDPDFHVIDECEDYIVVDKPAPLLVHPSNPGGPPTLWDGLKGLLAYDLANGSTLSIINRLDRETSGLVLVAKRAEAARRFGRWMRERQFRKRYVALVWGWPDEEEFDVEGPILRKGSLTKSEIWVKQMVHPSGVEAKTKFRVLERFCRETPNGSEFSLVEAFPVTGRMHQIRVHLSHVGHPIVGDKIYGPDERCYLQYIESGWSPFLERIILMPRQALHAVQLSVSEFCWEAPWPSAWDDWVKQSNF